MLYHEIPKTRHYKIFSTVNLSDCIAAESPVKFFTVELHVRIARRVENFYARTFSVFAKSCETRSIGYWNGVLALPAIIHWHVDDNSMANTPQGVMRNTNWSRTFTPRLKVCTRHSVRAMCVGVLWGLTLTIFLYSWAWINNIISRCQWSKPAECGWIGNMHMTPLITDDETTIKQRKTKNLNNRPTHPPPTDCDDP